MYRHSISLCMIVKNEEKSLDKCLKSVQNIVDEIIVVDTGSIDGTVEIAKKYGAKVYHFEWINDFAAARNFSLQHATGEYILILDADEYLGEDANIQSDLANQRDYYSVKIKNYRSDSRVLYHKNDRLFRKSSGLKFFGKLHENINKGEFGDSLTFADAKFIIHHDGYLEHVVQEKNKKQRNQEIMIKEVEENETGYNYLNLGNVYASVGEYEKALDAYLKSYRLDNSKTYVKYLLTNIAECYINLNRFEEGMIVLNGSISSLPNYTDFYYHKATLYEINGYLNDAELMYKKCLELGEIEDAVTFEGVGGYLSYFRLAKIYEKRGNQSEAFEFYFQALQLSKHYRPAIVSYIKMMLFANIRMEDTLSQLSKVYPISNIEDYKIITSVLYELRHPLLKQYIEVINGDLNTDFNAVAHQYAGQYKEAELIWEQLDKVPYDNIHDLLLLALLVNNDSLLNKCRSQMNVSDKEWKLIKRIILRNEIIGSTLSSTIEQILLVLSERLIVLNEFDLFEYISGIIMIGSMESQYLLAKMLSNYGFVDVAIDFLVRLRGDYPNKPQIIELIADLYFRNNSYNEALMQYQQLLSIKEEYSLYERIYKIYEALGDLSGTERIAREIRVKYPLSKWISEVHIEVQ